MIFLTPVNESPTVNKATPIYGFSHVTKDRATIAIAGTRKPLNKTLKL